MKKKNSGSLISVFLHDKTIAFPTGKFNSSLLNKFLQTCNDSEQIEKIYSNPTLRNFISTYGNWPDETAEIFMHGHLVRYIATDQARGSLVTCELDNSNKYHPLITEDFELNSLLVNPTSVSSSYLDSIQKFEKTNDELPYYVQVICLECNEIFREIMVDPPFTCNIKNVDRLGLLSTLNQ